MIRTQEQIFTAEQVKKIFNDWLSSSELSQLQIYHDYYESHNTRLMEKVRDRAHRGKTPNNYIPTAYYSTICDSMAGYVGQNVQYATSEQYQKQLNALLDENNVDVKDMKAWLHALAYNKACELVYTVGDGIRTDIKFSPLDPLNVIPIYNKDIEPQLFCALYICKDGEDTEIVVYYKDLEQTFLIYNDEISITGERALYFSECPVVIYRTELIGIQSPFHTVLTYIEALDWLITGNANEVDRLVDAILVISKELDDDEVRRMDEWKTLEGFALDDRAEYLTKDSSPAFRQYVSELLVREIHKHSHVIDWYSSETYGDASAKALRTRLFDMDMYSQRLEKMFRDGAYKRIRLIGEMQSVQNVPVDTVGIIYNRTKPSDLEDKLTALNQITFLSTRTKVELAGLDWETEQERLAEEMPSINLDGVDIV
jgi:SPP1 family phage portal protein